MDHRLVFACVGPQRTATSWLHKYLRGHPQLAFPLQVKETMFFDEHYHKGIDWYWRHFGTVDADRRLGEIAATYFDSDDALKRLKSFEGLRIIIGVRDPVERTYSLFRHHRTEGRVPSDFFAAVKQMPRIETSGMYARYCPRWEAEFGAERCHYVLQPLVESSPQEVIDGVCRFLEVDSITLPVEGRERFGQATQPGWPLAAKAAAMVSGGLRARGLHRPVEIAKRLGLRRALYGKPAGEEAMPRAERDHLLEVHAADLAFLHAKFAGRFL